MTNELQTKLDAILEDKNNNLKPENLKAGVTCLGVEGTLENIDITGITTTPDNVEYGKKFINKSGKLDTGRFTPVTMLYKDVDVDVEMQTLTKTFGTDTSLVFNNLGIFWDTDGLHIIHNISDTTETIEQYDFTTEDTEIKYVDAGCKDYFGTDTILIILTTGKVMYLYLYDISTNELTLKNTIPYGASSYPALNPEYNIVHLNDGQQYATYSSSKMYEISSTFTLSTLYTIKLSWGTTASRVQNIFWINKDMYHVLRNNSKTSDLYNYSEDMTVGATHRLKLDRTGYVHINTSAIVNGYEYYIVGASPDSSIIIRANTALGKGRIFTTSFENSVYTETDTGLNCTASAYTRALFLSNSTFMTLYTGMYIYKLHDNTIEQIANYTGSFGKLINRYYPVISYNNVYNKLLVADATSAINKVIVKGQTFVDPSLVPSGGMLAEEEYNTCLELAKNINGTAMYPISNSLVCYYYGTDLIDKSSNNVDGTLYGAYTLGEDYIEFNGGYGTTGNINNSKGTFEVFCNIPSDFTPNNSTQWYNCSCVFGCELDDAQQDFAIVIDQNGNFALGYDRDTILSTNIKANDGQNHHLVLIATDNKLKLYVDHVHETSISYTMSGSIPTQYGIFWNNMSTDSTVKGKLYTMRYYSNSLSTENIKHNYQCCINGIY